MKDYLETLITEKGESLNSEIQINGHFGIDYNMLIEYICIVPQFHHQIKTTLVKIDFMNGDVFHYLRFLAIGMVKAQGFEVEED